MATEKPVLSGQIKPRAVTSASNFFRRVLCPGSYAMEAGIPSKETEYSAEGKLLHDLFLTGKRPDELTQDQKDVLDLADMYAEEHFSNTRRHFAIPAEAKFVDEREVPMTFEAPDGSVLMPGHADVIRTWPVYDVRSVVDAKFGYLEVEHAADNWQTAIYAAMRHQSSPAKATTVCIDQPRNFGPRKTEAVYHAEQMPKLMKEIVHYDARSKADGGKTLVAGEKQCHFCKAKAKCPAYAEMYLPVLQVGDTAVQSLDDERLIGCFTGIQFANKIKDEVYDEMRYRIEQGTLTGFKLQNSGDDVTLVNNLGFFVELQSYFGKTDGVPNLSATAYDNCREMGWTRLVTLVRNLTGLSEKKAKELIKDLSAAYVERKPKAKKVVRDKEVKALPQ